MAKLRNIIEERSCTHCFYFWTLGEPYPHLSIPTYCFIHDLAWKVVPESYPGRDLRKLDESVMGWVSSSSCAFTNSDQTRDEVIEMVPSMSDKVHTVLLAAANKEGATHQSGEEPSTQDSLPFFLYPSAPNPQKNHIVLFKAVLDLLARGLRFKLVLTGGHTGQLLGEVPMERKAPEEARRFFQKHKELLSDTIIAEGHVSENMLTTLFNKCIAILMPSEYEGFGLPVAEAFAYGKPVIASNLAVFREQVACYDADEFVETFPATDHKILADLMGSRLQEGELSPERSQELRNKTAKWKWEDVAKAYVQLMQQSDRPAAIA